MMFKLENVIQNYRWGSASAMADMFGIDNPEQLPQAELWMGAHPNGCSRLDETDRAVLLSDFISQRPEQTLGHYTRTRYQKLPFLLKVLAPEKPLSIQVHPKKSKAKQGFTRENRQGIPVDAPERNYRDDNHKPELVYALTPYRAMNGFRSIDAIVHLFEQFHCASLVDEVQILKQAPRSGSLERFFRGVLSLHGSRKKQAIAELMAAVKMRSGFCSLAIEAADLIGLLAEEYPLDLGLFAPLMLNLTELSPGEAMYLDAETPHAYIKGVGIEIMANSDNVLRAGLTPKHIDVDELVANTRFEPTPPERLRLAPMKLGQKLMFVVPVDDFKFEILHAAPIPSQEYVRSAEILFCIDGEVILKAPGERVVLKRGQSAFISEGVVVYSYQGVGRLARAFN
jgi:mannose-6-phosphate isomerase